MPISISIHQTKMYLFHGGGSVYNGGVGGIYDI
jgi:hypothetical protein